MTERAQRNTPWARLALAATFVATALPAHPQEGERPAELGFVQLFDGESLEGWVTTGGRYDGHAAWRVEDGAIVGREGPGGQGGLLYTEKRYASFVLRLEAKLRHPFDSGVFLRMAPEGKGAQVTLDDREGGEIGAIYSDGYLQHNETGARLFRRDEWNEIEVRCTGFDMRIECWLNGELLVDYGIPPGTRGYAPTGLIGLQVHGGGVEGGSASFRNIRVRELPLFGGGIWQETETPGIVALTDAASARGWKQLFDGESLAGWNVAGEDGRYIAENGELAFLARGGGGQLESAANFTDFRLRLDFKMSMMANSGVFLRAARDGSNPAYSGCEVQILDDFNWEEVTGSTLQPYQFTGGLYASVPSGDPDALRPLGEWNTYEMLYEGTRLAVALNGRVLYDVDTLEVPGEPPFSERAKTGFIGLQHHGAHNIEAETMAWFRNVFVQPLERE